MNISFDPDLRLPDLELVRLIGQGSYGEVWMASSITGAWRAVKIVRRSSFSDPRPFEREFEGVKQAEELTREHAGLVDILQVGRSTDGEFFYYAMELADDANAECGVRNAELSGAAPSSPPRSAFDSPHSYVPRTLRNELKRSVRIPVAESLLIVTALAEAVAFLHSHGLVHRDIKTSNVIFVEGVPKLADVGLVTSRDTALSLVGTEGYLPPEGPGTEAADVYALGKVLYEIATGLDAHKFPELPDNFRDFADREAFLGLNELIAQACETNPGKRPSAAHLARELRALGAGKTFWRRRREVVRVLMGAIICAIGLGTAWLAWREMLRRNLDAGLLAYYPFDGDASDASGNGNTGTVHGAQLVEDRNAKAQSAYAFNGADQYITAMVDRMPLGMAPRTLAAWVQPQDGHMVRGVIDQGRGDCTGRMFGMVSVSGSLNFWGGCQEPGSKVALPTNQWSFVAISYDGRTIRLMSNGTFDEGWVGPLNTFPSLLFIGAETIDDGASFRAFFRGFIDEVRIYDRALSSTELRELYRREIIKGPNIQAHVKTRSLPAE